MSSLLTTINPATGREIASYPVYDEHKIARALALAQKTYAVWKEQTLADRALVLKNIAGALRRDKELLARLATEEMGKPIRQSREEVEKCARTLDFYADHGASFLADEMVATDASKSYVSYRPLGVSRIGRYFALWPRL